MKAFVLNRWPNGATAGVCILGWLLLRRQLLANVLNGVLPY
jgi:hypothetical protein